MTRYIHFDGMVLVEQLCSKFNYSRLSAVVGKAHNTEFRKMLSLSLCYITWLIVFKLHFTILFYIYFSLLAMRR